MSLHYYVAASSAPATSGDCSATSEREKGQTIAAAEKLNTDGTTEEDVHIKNFRDTHKKDPELLGRNADDETNRIADVCLFRDGYLTDSLIRQIVAGNPNVNQSN